METKHTQGEWSVSKTVNDYAIHTEGSPKDIALVYEYSRAIPKEEAEANAKLIAAAPDLLQSLRQFIHSVQHEGVINGRVVCAVRNAEDIIRKATQL